LLLAVEHSREGRSPSPTRTCVMDRDPIRVHEVEFWATRSPGVRIPEASRTRWRPPCPSPVTLECRNSYQPPAARDHFGVLLRDHHADPEPWGQAEWPRSTRSTAGLDQLFTIEEPKMRQLSHPAPGAQHQQKEHLPQKTLDSNDGAQATFKALGAIGRRLPQAGR
jgi:hypothetical protein